MSIFLPAIKRNIGLENRTEDTCLIYNSPKYQILLENIYHNYLYIISVGLLHYPVITIAPKDIFISIYSGSNKIQVKDRHGITKTLTRTLSSQTFFHIYNDADDYIKDKNESGHKYTLKELELDCKAFIDNICKDENQLTDHLD